MLIDQHMHADAVDVDFFNRPAATTSALAALAMKTGAPVVPRFALPLPGGRFRMVYEHPVEPPPPDDPTHCASSRSAAPTSSRSTFGATPSCGCGCTGVGATPAGEHVGGMFPRASSEDAAVEDLGSIVDGDDRR